MEELPSEYEYEEEEQVDQDEEEQDQDEEKRLLHMHGAISTLLAEECTLVDDMDTDHAACVPVLSMLAHQKLDLELHLRSIDLEKKNEEESENFLVKKP